jgi:hypothetical protein
MRDFVDAGMKKPAGVSAAGWAGHNSKDDCFYPCNTGLVNLSAVYDFRNPLRLLGQRCGQFARKKLGGIST